MKTIQTKTNTVPPWNKVTIESITVAKGMVRGPFGGALTKDTFVSNGYKVYEQKNAIYQTTEIGTYFIHENKYHELRRFSVHEGDFIISCSGTIGKIYQIPKGAPKGVINQALLKITIDKTKFNNQYFYYHFILPKFQSLVIDNTQGGAMQNLVGMDIFRNITMYHPPLPEQNRIVAVLETWDKAIEKMEKKIEIKKQIKRGLMQSLLTGKKRIRGFKDKWKKMRVDEIFHFIKTYAFSREHLVNDTFNTHGIGNIHYGDIHSTFGSSSINLKNTSVPSVRDISFVPDMNDLLINGDLIMADVSEDYDGIGVTISVHGLENKKVVGGLHTFVLRDNFKKTSEQYRQYIFINPHLRNKLKKNANGVSVYGISKRSLSGMILVLPPISEQNAIANILTIADKEIKELEKKLGILKDQKKYLLNNLVTGAIRTPEDMAI